MPASLEVRFPYSDLEAGCRFSDGEGGRHALAALAQQRAHRHEWHAWQPHESFGHDRSLSQVPCPAPSDADVGNALSQPPLAVDDAVNALSLIVLGGEEAYCELSNEESDEECAWAPRSPTGKQGSDLMARKLARQHSLSPPLTGMIQGSRRL